MKTAKFGGSSLANSTQLKKVAEIIKADETRRFIVVSAPGKRFATDKKVTDLLVEFYQKRLKNEATDQLIVDIFKRYEEIGKDFQVEENILDQIYQSLNHLKELAVENNPIFWMKFYQTEKIITPNLSLAFFKLKALMLVILIRKN